MAGFPRELGDEFETYLQNGETPKDFRRPSENRFNNDVANALCWASIALIGIFIASVISIILPIQLLDSEWQDKLINRLMP